MILLLPLVAVGSAVDTSVNISDGFGRANSYSLTTVLTSILNALWIVFSAIAVILFVIAGILFLTASGAPEKLSTARSALIWGVVGVAVAIIAYSIITIVSGVLGNPTNASSYLISTSIFSV